MKIKKILIAFLVTIVTIGSTVAFAAMPTNTAGNFNSSNNEQTNLEDESPIEAALRNSLGSTNSANENVNNVNVANNVSNVNSNRVENSSNRAFNSTNSSTNTLNEVTSDDEDFANKIVTEEKVLDDVYDSGNSIEYKSTLVAGNVYICAKDVNFEDSEITGNVFIFAQNITLKDVNIGGSAYIFGGNIEFNESSVDSAYILGNKVTIDKNSRIETDARLGGENVTLNGKVGRNLYIAASNVEISGNADFGKSAKVSAKEYNIPEDILNSNGFELKEVNKVVEVTDYLPEIIAEFIIVLILVAAILNSSEKFVNVNRNLKVGSFIKAFFTGLIELVLISVILLAIAFFGVGVKYAVALYFLMISLLLLGEVVFIAALSVRLVKNARSNIVSKAVGTSIIISIILVGINVIGYYSEIGLKAVTIIHVILAIIGFGTLVRVFLSSNKKNSGRIVISENKYNEVKEASKAPEVAPVKEVKENEEPKEEAKDEKLKKEEDENAEKFEISGEITKKDKKKKSKDEK